MALFGETLRHFMDQVGIGAKNLSKLTGIPKPQIDSWLREEVRHPRRWPPLLTIAHVLRLTSEEADTLLRSAGYPSIAELIAQLGVDHPDRRHLQPWVGIIPRSPISHHQLRAPVSDFVGRTAEIEHLAQALRQASEHGTTAAITGVQGMGGIGKTELAYVVANQVRPAFPDAQIVLTLQGVNANPLTPEQVLQAVLRAFTPDDKLPEDLPTLEKLYRAQLHEKRVLILADNAHSAIQVQSLLTPPGCALLITSRQRLTLPAMTTINLEVLSADEAIQLLSSICPRLTPDEAQILAHACGYLPLALRVSGGLLHATPALKVTDYLANLADTRQRLANLKTLDDSQLDVEASLQLSYMMLGDDAQQVFRQLGVIVADFATELAQAVVEVPNDQNVTWVLHHLLRRNLIMYEDQHRRWRLHDLVRDLAQQRLETAGDVDATQWRYARVAVQIAHETQDQYLMGGDELLTALARFDTERPHIDAGRDWAMIKAGTLDGDQLLLEIAALTAHIGVLRYDTQRERIPQGEAARAAAQRLRDQQAEGFALNNLGLAYSDLGNPQQAIPYFEQRLTLAYMIGNRHAEGVALSNLGRAYIELGNPRCAVHYFEQALTIFHTTGDWRGEGSTMNNLGLAYLDLGNVQHAIPYFEQDLAITRELGDRCGEGQTLGNLGHAYLELGDTQRAILYYTQALTIAREVGNRRSEVLALYNLGHAHTDLGEIQHAIEYCDLALTNACIIGDRRSEGYVLRSLARAQAYQGSISLATTTYSQAVTLFHSIGDRDGEAECKWQFGLALIQQGKREQALPLLRVALIYEQEIGHTKAQEHAALLTRLEAGEELPPEWHIPLPQ